MMGKFESARKFVGKGIKTSLKAGLKAANSVDKIGPKATLRKIGDKVKSGVANTARGLIPGGRGVSVGVEGVANTSELSPSQITFINAEMLTEIDSKTAKPHEIKGVLNKIRTRDSLTVGQINQYITDNFNPTLLNGKEIVPFTQCELDLYPDDKRFPGSTITIDQTLLKKFQDDLKKIPKNSLTSKQAVDKYLISVDFFTLSLIEKNTIIAKINSILKSGPTIPYIEAPTPVATVSNVAPGVVNAVPGGVEVDADEGDTEDFEGELTDDEYNLYLKNISHDDGSLFELETILHILNSSVHLDFRSVKKINEFITRFNSEHEDLPTIELINGNEVLKDKVNLQINQYKKEVIPGFKAYKGFFNIPPIIKLLKGCVTEGYLNQNEINEYVKLQKIGPKDEETGMRIEQVILRAIYGTIIGVTALTAMFIIKVKVFSPDQTAQTAQSIPSSTATIPDNSTGVDSFKVKPQEGGATGTPITLPNAEPTTVPEEIFKAKSMVPEKNRADPLVAGRADSVPSTIENPETIKTAPESSATPASKAEEKASPKTEEGEEKIAEFINESKIVGIEGGQRLKILNEKENKAKISSYLSERDTLSTSSELKNIFLTGTVEELNEGLNAYRNFAKTNGLVIIHSPVLNSNLKSLMVVTVQKPTDLQKATKKYQNSLSGINSVKLLKKD